MLFISLIILALMLFVSCVSLFDFFHVFAWSAFIIYLFRAHYALVSVYCLLRYSHIAFVWWDWLVPPGDISMVKTGVTLPPNERTFRIFHCIIFIHFIYH